MRSVVDLNVVIRRIPVTVLHNFNTYTSVNNGFIGFLLDKL